MRKYSVNFTGISMKMKRDLADALIFFSVSFPALFIVLSAYLVGFSIKVESRLNVKINYCTIFLLYNIYEIKK